MEGWKLYRNERMDVFFASRSHGDSTCPIMAQKSWRKNKKLLHHDHATEIFEREKGGPPLSRANIVPRGERNGFPMRFTSRTASLITIYLLFRTFHLTISSVYNTIIYIIDTGNVILMFLVCYTHCCFHAHENPPSVYVWKCVLLLSVGCAWRELCVQTQYISCTLGTCNIRRLRVEHCGTNRKHRMPIERYNMDA